MTKKQLVSALKDCASGRIICDDCAAAPDTIRAWRELMRQAAGVIGIQDGTIVLLAQMALGSDRSMRDETEARV